MTSGQIERAAAVSEFIALYDLNDVDRINVVIADLEHRLGPADALDVLTAAAERIRVRLEARAEVGAWAQRVAGTAPPGLPFALACAARVGRGDAMAQAFLALTR